MKSAFVRLVMAAAIIAGAPSPASAQSSTGDINTLLKSDRETGGGDKIKAEMLPEAAGASQRTNAELLDALLSASASGSAESVGYMTEVTPEAVVEILKRQKLQVKLVNAGTDYPWIRIGKSGGRYITFKKHNGRFLYMTYQLLLGFTAEGWNRIPYAQINKYNTGWYINKAAKYKTKKSNILKLDIDFWIGDGLHADAVVTYLAKFLQAEKPFREHFNLAGARS